MIRVNEKIRSNLKHATPVENIQMFRNVYSCGICEIAT
jgi:hypothetical protein